MKDVRTCLRFIWENSRPVRPRMLVSILVGGVRIGASLGFVALSRLLVDIATGVSDARIGPAIALFVSVLALQIGVNLFAQWWDSYSHVKAQNLLRMKLFSHVLESRWDGREKFLSGDTVNRLEEDIRVLAELTMNWFPGIVITLMQLLAASVYLMSMAPGLLWLLLLLMASAVFGSKLFFRQIRKLQAAIRSRESDLQQLMQESLQHRVLMLTLSGVERVLDKFGWYQQDIENNTRKRLNYNAVARGLMFLGFQAGHVAAFLWGIFGIRGGTVTYGMMTAFMQLVGQVQRPIADLGRQVPAFINALASVERLMELQELEKEPQAAAVHLTAAPEIVVDRVSFAYPQQEQPVLRDFSCRFPAGSLTAVAGPTGVGKSTLIRLVLGLLKPSSGSITVGGHPCGAGLRENFMYIPQGNSLLSGTIRSNLLLADPSASDQQLREALETAVAQFVYTLPDGLDTVCGEVGSGLSEGQSQRIAIARALLRKGGVLILDESTSALDAATEQLLLQNLHTRYHGKKTILFISHREAVVRSADHTVTVG